MKMQLKTYRVTGVIEREIRVTDSRTAINERPINHVCVATCTEAATWQAEQSIKFTSNLVNFFWVTGPFIEKQADDEPPLREVSAPRLF